MPRVSLGERGRAQSLRLAGRLGREPITHVHSSPRERARETAAPIAQQIGVSVAVSPALDEVDVGEWTGTSFAKLRPDPRWHHWNRARESARSPGGESLRDVQERVVCHIEQLSRAHQDAHILLVSHGDVIKAALLFYLTLPLWALDRLEIAPASLSAIAIGNWGAKILTVNEVVS
jgi:broad specificity phosphatase PhoE